ncbi:hypothetical protein K8O68_08095 [Salipaludibacillus sp. CUR1]|uniref:HD-GYP domain-containing protein n=1 Tax=Salipaludibacillus sp. CUR1 TaxID=2820003 RepID=UPI001E423CBC|nr:hypothetical protein [Salipaludibacillus sp. CUR1]
MIFKKENTGEKILISLALFFTLVSVITVSVQLMAGHSLTLITMIAYLQCMLFYWGGYLLYTFYIKGRESEAHGHSFIMLALFLLTVFNNPFHYSEMWISLLLFPLLLALHYNVKIYYIWGALFIIFYKLFLLYDTDFNGISSAAEFTAANLDRLVYGIAVLFIGFFIIQGTEKKRLEALEENERQKRVHLMSLLHALVPVVETKTQITREEIAQSSDLMLKMSHYFPEERIQRWEVELLAVIHFVSRVQWPDYLFEKEERLTDIEFEVVKQHCVMGRDIIGEDAAFSRIRTAAEQHHERIDGKGYPYGLGGEEIAVLSQILGITEAYLAMTTSRAYREALSCEEALGQIRKEKGGTFDPNVVNAFLKVMSGKSSQTDVKAS